MKSAGNDIVALNAIDIQRTISPAFYSKFIVPEECALYRQPQFTVVPFVSFVWMLWSVKESVYKYLKRHQPDLIFSPAKIVIQNISVPEFEKSKGLCDSPLERGEGVCSLGMSVNTPLQPRSQRSPSQEGNLISDNNNVNFYTGEVISGTHRLYFRSKMTNELIASVVNGNISFDNVYWGVKSIQNISHEHQSKEVRKFILNRLQQVLGADDLRIEKTATGCPVVFNRQNLLGVPVSLAHHGQFVAYSFYGC